VKPLDDVEKKRGNEKRKKKNFIDPNTLAYFARTLLVLVESLRKPKLIFFSIRWFVPSFVRSFVCSFDSLVCSFFGAISPGFAKKGNQTKRQLKEKETK
jgi:hypothetical protein